MPILKQIFKILSEQNKKKIYFLVFLSLVGMNLEIIGISMIMPLLIMFTDSGSIPVYLIQTFDNLDVRLNTHETITIILVALLIFFLIKFLFLLYLSYKQQSFVYRLQAQLSTLMFRGYLLAPFSFHLRHNSTELIRNVIGEVHQFTGAVLALLVFITEVLVLIGLIILLLFIEPAGAIVSFVVLGMSGLIFDTFSKKYVKNWGFKRQKYEGTRLRHLNQGLNAYKEIKISSTEEVFISKYNIDTVGVSEMEIKANVLSNTPKLGLELLAVLGVFVLIFTLFNLGKAFNEIVPIIAIFSIAAFRIMPSVNRLINTGQVIRYHLAVIMMLEKEITYFKSLIKEKHNKEFKINGIEINDVNFKYEVNKELTLKNINIKIKNGEFIGIIGQSGSGKSTLINLILGLLEPSKGTIKSYKKNISSDIVGWQSQIGYVPQDVYLIDDTIKNNIAFGLNNTEVNDKKLKEAIKVSSLEFFLDGLPLGLDTIVGEKGDLISGGQKQRIGLARAIYNNPKILILDEATSALDGKIEKSIIDNLNKLSSNTIIIMVTHREKSLKYCDNIYEVVNKTLVKK